MARLQWLSAALACASLASAGHQQPPPPSSTSSGSPTATSSGPTSTYSQQFMLPADIDNGPNVLPNIRNPDAKNAQDVCPGYTASNVQLTEWGFQADLALAGTACNVYGTDIDKLKFEFAIQSEHRMRVNIQPSEISAEDESHYLLAADLVPFPEQEWNPNNEEIDLQFSWTNEPSFGFKVLRRSTGDTLFDTTGSVLVYENQFIEFVTALPTDYNLFGLGEQIRNLKIGYDQNITIFAADAGDPIDYNIYGSHPVYLDTRYYEVDESTGAHTLVTTDDTSATGDYLGRSHGVYLRNAHAQEILARPNSLTWRTLGGSIDLYFFDGPTAPDVMAQYHTGAVGLPAMQQYWSFGFHQCRWGYTNWSEVEAVVKNYRDFDIPLETIWTDIDYMYQYRDFENDPIRYPYPEGQAFLERLHAAGQHYVPIVDSALYVPNPANASDAYPIYTDGNNRGVFLKNPDGSQYQGAVWPGVTVFPDWHAEQSVPWWTDSLKGHHDKIAWDGIWIDMSEVSSFCVGSCGQQYLHVNPVLPPFQLPGAPGNIIYSYPEGFNITNATEAAAVEASAAAQASADALKNPPSTSTTPYFPFTVPTPGVRNVNQPPYVINNVQGDLAVHAVSPNATHVDGVLEYDVHNLWGYQILNATYQALLEVFPEKRPFIIGRSTFAGAGKWAGHWGGDNTSLFAYMYFSISQALSFSLFGIPMFGVDTCGFNGNSDEELCNRWMQLSAFFPFYRNHNVLSANSQEAYVWASVAAASKRAMQIRYSLLPYIYTTFHQAHTAGSTVMRALAWEFPNEPALAPIDNQFLFGPAILVTPVLGQGLTEAKGVFPGVGSGQKWYDWYTQAAVAAQPGENVTIPAPLGHIPVYIRGGYILPQQEALYTTAASRNSSWSLLCALDGDGSAAGTLYVDDGESLVPNADLHVNLLAANNTLYASPRGLYQDRNALANVTVMGVSRQPSKVLLNGESVSGFEYNGTSQVLSVKGLQGMTSGGAWSADWTLSWM